MSYDRYDDPAKGTRHAITGSLIVGGAIAGALVGLAVTPLGKFVAGASPADTAEYVWNATAFGLIGTCLAPMTVWIAMRSVPLWRTLTEPLAGAVVGAGVGVALGSAAAFLALMPIGAAVAVARLAVSHRRPRLSGAGRLIGR